jgi:hypothetical protein
MKRIKLLLMVFLSSCSINYRYSSSKSIDISNDKVQQIPVVVDLIVDTIRVKGGATNKYEYRLNDKLIKDTKKLAISNDIKLYGIDVLVFPTYEIGIQNNTIAVIVKGYPGKYKNFRKIKEEDIKYLNIDNRIIINK